ncbi:hypothetical protein GCM10022226_39740 [Sphaerisporangium flaviroseum]|uniref:DUF2752 domain-containing protein n=1 Tax=Sphaerisporangium flaviroseum TaxID=509199 RepID=A0ABP7ICG9_9ACTN
MDVLDAPVPDAGPVFLLALAVHVAAGLTCVNCGASAMAARKGGVVVHAIKTRGHTS